MLVLVFKEIFCRYRYNGEAYQDTFEELSNWVPNLLGGQWYLEGGKYVGESTVNNLALTTLRNRKFTNASVSFDLELSSNSKDEWSGVLLRKQTPDGQCWDGCYMIYYTGEGDLKLYSGGDIEGASKNIGYTGESVNIRIEMKENKLVVYANDELAFEYIDVDAKYMDGYISFCTYQTKAKFDNVKIDILETDPGEIIQNQAFQDLFINDVNWAPIKLTGGEFEIIDETYRIKGTKDSEAATALLKNRKYDNATIIVDMSLTSESKDQWAGILFRKQDSKTGCWDGSYMLYYTGEGQLKLYGDGARGDVAVADIGYIPGEVVTLKIEMKNDTLEVYANDVKQFSYTDPEYKYQNGYIALCSYMSEVKFDNMQIAVEKEEIEDVTTTLQGRDKVQADEEFAILLGIINSQSPIYAMDLNIEYDNELLTFKEFTQIGETLLVGSEEEKGILRVLTAHPDGIIDQMQLLSLNFKAKDIQNNQIAKVEITEGNLVEVVEGKENMLKTKGVLKEISITGKVVIEKVPEDVNSDQVINIADLALVAYYYGISNKDQELWEQAKKVDVNQDGRIDIQDLSQVASKILE